jgi:hypothetical protein
MSDHEQLQEIAHINRRETGNGIFPDGEYDIQVCSYDEEPSHLHIIKDGWDVSFTIEDGELLTVKSRGRDKNIYDYMCVNVKRWLSSKCAVLSIITNQQNASLLWGSLHDKEDKNNKIESE